MRLIDLFASGVDPGFLSTLTLLTRANVAIRAVHAQISGWLQNDACVRIYDCVDFQSNLVCEIT